MRQAQPGPQFIGGQRGVRHAIGQGTDAVCAAPVDVVGSGRRSVQLRAA